MGRGDHEEVEMASFEQRMSRALAVLLGMMIIGSASTARAFPSGVSTANFGPLGCNQCHTGGQTPTVTLVGPGTVAPGSTTEYTLAITAVGTQTLGGFNVSSTFGTLATGGANASHTQPTTGADGRREITHFDPKPASGGAISFSFLWTAPDSFTSVTLNAWGNAVNGNASPTGDLSVMVSLVVASSMPGPNPTNTPTPTPIPTPTPVVHDVVVSAVKPLNLSIAAGKTAVAKNLSVKVTNADPKNSAGLVAVLNVTSDCPTGVTAGPATFGGVPGGVFLKAGQSKTAKVAVNVTSDAFTTLNHTAAGRCTLTLSATSSLATSDPNPSNNSVTAEINVTDKNDPDQATVDESFTLSLAPLKISIPAGETSKLKTIKPTVGNADILPVPASPGDAISITATDGDCPPGTVGMAVPASVTVKGGKKQAVALTLTIDGNQFTTGSSKSPARCTAEVTATGAADPDPDPTNNTTKLVIDVIDNNDF